MKYRGLPPIAALAGVFLLITTTLWTQEYKTCLFPAIDLSTSDEYREYQQRVSMFLPVKWIARRLARQPIIKH